MGSEIYKALMGKSKKVAMENAKTFEDEREKSEQVDNRTSEQVDNFNDLEKPKDLKLNQFRVLYEIYHNRPFKVSGPDRIGGCVNFNIPYGTIRNCLKSLAKKNYISKVFSVNNGVQKGII